MVATPAYTWTIARHGRGKYEEYHPYGTTAWWAGDSALVSQKRYKYTGMERDEESGLQCHGVRYDAAWLGRWVSADPIGLGDGGNRFTYCAGCPCCATDRSGMLGVALGRAVPETLPEPIRDTPARRTYRFEDYVSMLEKELSPLKKFVAQDSGCVGMTCALIYRDDQITELTQARPVFDNAFGNWDEAQAFQRQQQAKLAAEGVTDKHVMIFLFRFGVGESGTDYARSFDPDPETGRIDMSLHHPKRRTGGLVNFETGWWDESTESVWHANEGGEEMVVFQSTKESFLSEDMGLGWTPGSERVAFSVVITDAYDPTKAKASLPPTPKEQRRERREEQQREHRANHSPEPGLEYPL